MRTRRVFSSIFRAKVSPLNLSSGRMSRFCQHLAALGRVGRVPTLATPSGPQCGESHFTALFHHSTFHLYFNFKTCSGQVSQLVLEPLLAKTDGAELLAVSDASCANKLLVFYADEKILIF